MEPRLPEGFQPKKRRSASALRKSQDAQYISSYHRIAQWQHPTASRHRYHRKLRGWSIRMTVLGAVSLVAIVATGCLYVPLTIITHDGDISTSCAGGIT
jgi:hypothetical protein